MFKNVSEAAAYTKACLGNLAPEEEHDVNVLEFSLSQLMMEELDGDLSEAQKEHIIEKIDDEAYVEGYIAQYVPNFYTALENAVVYFLSPYFLEIQEA